MASAAVRRYWSKVAELGCVVCGQPAQIAHVAGKPSVTERMQEPKAKGKKLPRMDWIVLPACDWHANRAPDALDINPAAFERNYGAIAGYIDRLAARFELPLWDLAKRGRK